MKILGLSVSYQLIDIFNIIEDENLSLEQKRDLVKKYQYSLTEDSENSVNLGNGSYYLFGKVNELSYDKLVKIKDHIDKNINSFTCEAEMKMNSMIKRYDKQSHSIKYNFKYSDIVYNYAMKHGKKMRGHTLVWHLHQPKALDEYIEDNLGTSMEEYSKGNPDEFLAKRRELTLNFLDDYMKKIGEKYSNCYCWDIINEIVCSGDKEKDCNRVEDSDLRKSKWSEYIGKDNEGNDFYIEVLKLARKNLPQGTKLFYNEYDEFDDEKRKAIIGIIENIKEYEKNHIEEFPNGLLDGVGLQSHYNVAISPEKMDQTYGEFYKTRKEIQITEADIPVFSYKKGDKVKYNKKDIKKADKLWSQMYKSANKYNIESFTSWGVSDELSWYTKEDKGMATLIDEKGNLKSIAKRLFKQRKSDKQIQVYKKRNTFLSAFRKVIQEANIFNKENKLAKNSQDIEVNENDMDTKTDIFDKLSNDVYDDNEIEYNFDKREREDENIKVAIKKVVR